jgi:hypothetical protein
MSLSIFLYTNPIEGFVHLFAQMLENGAKSLQWLFTITRSDHNDDFRRPCCNNTGHEFEP